MVPGIWRTAGFKIQGAIVSVNPYPSRIVRLAFCKKTIISGDSGAPPETRKRIRPPKRL